MSKTHKSEKPIDAEEIAAMADVGEDVSRFFTNAGTIVYPPHIQRINVDFSTPMLEELDRAARELNMSRQAVIKSMVRQSLDNHYLAAAHQSERSS